MSTTNYYRVYERHTGELAAEGSAKECAKILGIHVNTFKQNARENREGGRFEYEVTEPMDSETKALIRKWDELVTPLREKYGVKVWRGDGERWRKSD